MTNRVFNQEQTTKLRQLINESIGILQEVETLTGGLNDTIKSIAEELEIKPSILKRAIKVAHKARLGETNEDHQVLNDILETVGKTS